MGGARREGTVRGKQPGGEGAGRNRTASYFRLLRSTMRTDLTSTRWSGRDISPPADMPTGVLPICSRMSSPRINLPKPVYWPSRKGAGSRQMKNWQPAESGSRLRAMERTPRTWGFWLNSALIL